MSVVQVSDSVMTGSGVQFECSYFILHLTVMH